MSGGTHSGLRHNERVRSVVLLSGGLDSAVALAIAREAGDECAAITFRYGQRHAAELECAKAQSQGCFDHLLVDIDPAIFRGSALVGDADVPKDRDLDSTEVPVTYVPARNTLFLSYALAWSEVLGAERIVTGMNAVDYSGYPDCRPDYVAAYTTMANLALQATTEGRYRLEIFTPLIEMTKVDIVRRGLELGVDFKHTSSCYDPGPNGDPCAHCDSCLHRAAAFQALGEQDPRYELTHR